MIAFMQKVDVLAKNWFIIIIKNKVFEGSTWDPCQLGN